ncbi:T5orf172 domain protein [Methanobrevibacter cuticularis]|uniref:T5orf172 domain protein n=1 Tax=Methanobrevibacter cuticularis TaxID=47311 RepID=A0A166EFW9_9EURY|nr:DUF4041 domain-containing protein [Methanobrevibacter cuticularis]KZX16608.1 T5orf172 domain protein [Methanobrevibacter cuticularis]
MNIKEDKGLILIIVGIILTLTIVLFFIGIPLIAIGAYLLNKKVSDQEKKLDEQLIEKRNELSNIDKKLEQMEKEKEQEINNKLKEKQNQLDNIDATLEEMKEKQQKEINILLEDKKNQLDNIDNTLEKMEQEKQIEINNKIKLKQVQLTNLVNDIEERKERLGFLDDEAEMQEVGLYEPKYDFITAVAYKEKLDELRKKQKDSVKNKTAAVSGIWIVEGDTRKGKAMAHANIKQIIKNFNLECEITISKVKISNRENSIKRIKRSFESLNKINKPNKVEITSHYLNLKLQELDLAMEYALQKQEEKEAIKEAKQREREERKIQKQLDDQLKKTTTQKKQLETEIEATNNLLQKSKSDKEIELLKSKLKELELAVEKSKKDEKDIKDKRKRTGAGYVYILSNIGSFGENVYKIGVTRRDDPMGRVTELSDASVPFRFDNHVFIFSEEAFELEKELHGRFDHKRVNKVNMRKEFFNITLEDVKRIVEENKELVHSFVEKAEAQEYYDTLKMIK